MPRGRPLVLKKKSFNTPHYCNRKSADLKDWLLICWSLSPLRWHSGVWRWLRILKLQRGCATAFSTHYDRLQAIRLREQCVLKMMCVGTKSWNCLSSSLMGVFILNVTGRPLSWPVLWTLPSEFRKFWDISGFESKHNSFILLLGFTLGSRGK